MTVESIKILIGEYGWILITAFCAIIFQNFIKNLINGFLFMVGNTYNVDDVVYINGKKSRIVRQTPFRTTFYLIDDNRKLVVSNDRLSSLMIEKCLPENGKDR